MSRATDNPVARPDVEVLRDGPVVSIMVGGTEQSRIDTSRPGQLEFEYMQQMDAALRLAFPEPRPVRALHVGGCGCALAWAWEERRPGSRQVAVEVDPWIAEQARVWFPLPRKPALRIRIGDGRDVLAASQATFDVVVRDAFSRALVPPHLQTLEWAKLVSSHLSPAGLYLANCTHGGGVSCRGDIAAARQAFDSTLILGASKVVKGARLGNIVVVGWNAPGLIDRDELDRQLRRLPLPVSVIGGNDLDLWLGGVCPLLDPGVEGAS